MRARPTAGRLGAALLVMILLGAVAAPRAGAATGSDALIAGGILDPLNSLGSDIGRLALNTLGSAVLGGAGAALKETATVIDQTTAPRLGSTWFSSTYWRVAGLAALLTLPFLFAAAVQALLRSDLTLLLRAAFGFLPLAMIGVSLAAPITLLLLSVTDEMSSVVSGAGSGGGVQFLRQTAAEIVGLSGLDGSPFLGFAIGLMTLAAAIALALEMLIREAAVYVVVLMLPLAFAALVWPARRTWGVRLVELLLALILSKFVIVAVLSLAGAAYGSAGSPSATRLLTAMALVMLSTFAPWVMLRLLPFTELAASAGGALSAELPHFGPMDALGAADSAAAWTGRVLQRLRPSGGRSDPSDTESSPPGQPDAAGEAPYTPTDHEFGSLAPRSNSEEPGRRHSRPATQEESSDGPPTERLPGLAPRWQGADGTIEVFLGRGGSAGGSQDHSAAGPGASVPDADGALPPDAGGILTPEEGTGISASPPANDEPPLPRPKTPDEGRL